MRFNHLLVASAVLVSSAAFAAGQSQTMSNSGLPLPKDVKEVAQDLHQGNLKEIKLGQLAQQRGQSQEVKDYGKMLVNDHRQLDQQLMATAKQKGWKLSNEEKASGPVQKAMKDHEKSTEDLLKQLNGAAFDANFMASAVADHDTDVLKVQNAIQQFQGQDFTQTLQSQVLPKLDQHRQRAYQVLGDVQPKAQQMGVGGAGMGQMGGQQQDQQQQGGQEQQQMQPDQTQQQQGGGNP